FIRAASWSRYLGNRAYPPGFSRSVQVVMGVKPEATQSGKFFASTPAEKLMGSPAPKASRNLLHSSKVMTCRGAPERYMTFSEAGKKLLWFSTTSVFENFAPSDRPREEAR